MDNEQQKYCNVREILLIQLTFGGRIIVNVVLLIFPEKMIGMLIEYYKNLKNRQCFLFRLSKCLNSS